MEDVDVVENRHVYFSGGSSPPPPPTFPLLIFRPNWGPKRISKGLDDRPPAPLISTRSGSGAAFCCFQPFSSLKYHTPSPARLRADVLIFPSYLLLRSLVGLSASLTRHLGTRLFSHYFFCFYIYFIDFIFSSLDVCFIPFTFGTTVLIGTFVNI